MELRRIQYFVAVAEEAHFGRAAQRLQMAQPPLSQQIRALEAEMGVVLFHRTTRKVELTAAGERFLPRARAILAEVDDAVAEAAQVADGSLDLGLLRPPVHSTAIDVQVLRREPLIAVLPEHHALAGRDRVRLSDLRDDPFITYPSNHRSVVYEAVIDACQRAGFVPANVHEVAETSTMVSFVAAGLGVALVPASVQHLRITGATYLPLAGTTREVELALATRAGETSPHGARVRARAKSLIGGGGPACAVDY